MAWWLGKRMLGVLYEWVSERYSAPLSPSPQTRTRCRRKA